MTRCRNAARKPRRRFSAFWLVASLLILEGSGPTRVFGQDLLEQRVLGLVDKHYIDGVLYAEAKGLGREAVPVLLKLLDDTSQKQFWVNIVVTLGFIEDSSAREPLLDFLEKAEGEVDGFAVRALLAVPFAIGCIASNGDSRAFDVLQERARTPHIRRARWAFRGTDADRLLAEQAVSGLSVSGLPQARGVLESMAAEQGGPAPVQKGLSDQIRQGLATLDRIRDEGRSKIFNPAPDRR
jgi:hypothetical protein